MKERVGGAQRWLIEDGLGEAKGQGKMKRVKGLKRILWFQKEECADSGALATEGLTGDEDGGIMEAEQLGSQRQARRENKLPPRCDGKKSKS